MRDCLEARHKLLMFAHKLIGTPYIYGGNNPDEGFDCSGFVKYVLQHFAMLPRGDHSSAGMYENFKSRETGEYKPGNLVFFGSERVSHVAFVIDEDRILECGGGGSSTDYVWNAIARGAGVRISLKSRKDIIGICDPFKEE